MGALEYIVQGRLALKRGGILRVEDGSGIVIYVWEGAVWITQEGDQRDHHVKAGGWFRVDREGSTLVSPLGEGAQLSLTAPRPEGYAHRVGVLQAGAPA